MREELAAWVDTITAHLTEAQPDMPAGVTDRPAEIWEPLLLIADAAGGHWPDTARHACTHFVLESGPQVTSIGVRLLADLQHIFTAHGTDRMTSTDIIGALLALDESPWADLEAKPLSLIHISEPTRPY